jgi:hypothetical protein
MSNRVKPRVDLEEKEVLFGMFRERKGIYAGNKRIPE